MKNKIEQTAEILKALAHPTRLAIIIGLLKSNGECNVTIMVEKLGLSQPNISQHLTILRTAGIIEGYKKGSNVCYKVIDDKAKKLIECMKIEEE